jgi:uncharacterized metal-binding protein
MTPTTTSPVSSLFPMANPVEVDLMSVLWLFVGCQQYLSLHIVLSSFYPDRKQHSKKDKYRKKNIKVGVVCLRLCLNL